MNDLDILEPGETLPDHPLYASIDLLRQVLGQPPDTLWRYRVGEIELVCNAGPALVRIDAPVPFEIPNDTAILFMGRGPLGYVTKRGPAFIPDRRNPLAEPRPGERILRAIIEETFKERVDRMPQPRSLEERGVAVCDNCGVPLGEEPGDVFTSDRAGGTCVHCLRDEKVWLNRA